MCVALLFVGHVKSSAPYIVPHLAFPLSSFLFILRQDLIYSPCLSGTCYVGCPGTHKNLLSLYFPRAKTEGVGHHPQPHPQP